MEKKKKIYQRIPCELIRRQRFTFQGKILRMNEAFENVDFSKKSATKSIEKEK